MRALVIGASGQVGTVLTAALGRANVVPTYSQHPIVGGVQLRLEATGNAEAEAVLSQSRAQVVYCCGAATHVDACEDDPAGVLKINRDGPAALARAARERGLPFVYVSTDFVFDGKRGPYSEEDPTNALSSYGRSKLAGEEAILAAHPEALVVRTTLVYGPDPNGKNFAYALSRALANGRTMRAPPDQITTPTYNRDLAAAMIGLVDARTTGIFNIASGERMSRLEYAQRVARAAGLDASLILPVSTAELGQRAVRPLDAGLKVHKLRQALPSLRLHTVEEALTDWLSEPDPLFAARDG
jgi:dTDP-4-dehydrorhamnose reductase